MKPLLLALVLLMCLPFASRVDGVQDIVIVTIVSPDGKPVVFGDARRPPYKPGSAVPLQTYLGEARAGRDAQGRVVSGVGFHTTTESGAVRLTMFALVPRPGAANRYWARAGDEPDKMLVPDIVGSVLIEVGETRQLNELESLGIKPFSAVVERRAPGR